MAEDAYQRAVQAYEFIEAEDRFPRWLKDRPDLPVHMALIDDDGDLVVLHVDRDATGEGRYGHEHAERVEVVVREGQSMPDLDAVDAQLTAMMFAPAEDDGGWITTAQGMCRFLIFYDDSTGSLMDEVMERGQARARAWLSGVLQASLPKRVARQFKFGLSSGNYSTTFLWFEDVLYRVDLVPVSGGDDEVDDEG